jgi:hypothetical protein
MGSTDDAWERHGLFRCGAFMAGRSHRPLSAEAIFSGKLVITGRCLLASQCTLWARGVSAPTRRGNSGPGLATSTNRQAVPMTVPAIARIRTALD